MKKIFFQSLDKEVIAHTIKSIPVFVGIILFLNCAFLNTLYNARIAFKKSYREHMKYLHTNPDSTNSVPENIKAGYERTIKKSIKVIDIYPKRKRWHDDAMYLKAKATFYKGDILKAINRLIQLQQSYPQSPFIPESHLLLGKAYLLNNDLQKAEESFQFILDNYPEMDYKEDITLLMAEVSIKREGKSQAIKILEKSLTSVKSDEKKIDIILKLCILYYDLELYENVIQIIKKAPRNKNFPHFLFRIDYYLLISYKQLSKFQKAIDLANKMLKNKNYLIYEPKILVEKGIVLKNLKLVKDAINVFEDVIAGDGSSEIKGSAWFELALIYQFELGNLKKAKECYEKALSLSSDKKITEIARERIDGFNKIDEYITKLENTGMEVKDSVDEKDTPASIRYKLGEVYWLNLAEADSALSQFISIASDTSADSAHIMKSIYARAWILRFIKKDTTTSDSLYQVVINKFPATIIAQKSQQDMGKQVTIKTREDSARLAFIEAERNYFDKNDPVTAVNEYNRVAKKYFDVEEIAVLSIYAAAWLCDHILNKNKTALSLYNRLCDTFPESQLCINEASPRLKIVEDTLRVMEIRKQDKDKISGKTKENKKSQKSLDSTSSQEINEDLMIEENEHPQEDSNLEKP